MPRCKSKYKLAYRAVVPFGDSHHLRVGQCVAVRRQQRDRPEAARLQHGIWWDGDLLRELLDGTRIDKSDYERCRTEPILDAANFNCAANNGSKANPRLVADILGDWCEEVIWRSRDNRELRIFTTTAATELRLPCLMHNPIYRLSVAWQNIGYNQPTQVGFYFGDDMQPPPRPAIRTAR